MANLNEFIALIVNGEEITLQNVVRSLKWRDQLQIVKDAINATLVRQAVAEQGIEVSDEELQQAADDFRVKHELFDEDSTENWLAERHLTFEDWESMLEEEVLTRKLREVLTQDKVGQYFAERRLTLDAATLSRLVVKEEDVAKELRAEIVEEGADFYALARKYSVDEKTKPTGGYVGRVKRKEMEAAVESAVFGASEGKVVGPIKTDDGWELIKVEALHRATLNDETRELIQSLIFEEWLDEQRSKAHVDTPLLEATEEEEEEEVEETE